MFEPGEPWYELAPNEWHAFGYGLLEGFKFWKRRETGYNEIDSLDLSPEWKTDLKAKYHYYRVGFDLPEDLALVSLLVWYLTTNAAQLAAIASKFFGGI